MEKIQKYKYAWGTTIGSIALSGLIIILLGVLSQNPTCPDWLIYSIGILVSVATLFIAATGNMRVSPGHLRLKKTYLRKGITHINFNLTELKCSKDSWSNCCCTCKSRLEVITDCNYIKKDDNTPGCGCSIPMGFYVCNNPIMTKDGKIHISGKHGACELHERK